MAVRKYLRQLANRGVWYWLRVAVLIIAGIYLGDWLAERDYWINQRYKAYQFLQSQIPRKAHPQRTVLVLIGDEEYWKGELGARVPVRRDYLARMVETIDKANPAVVAIDFDLRSPSPDGQPVEFSAYRDETNKLLDAVKAASHNRKIILPKTVGYDDQHNYVSESDIYNGFDFENDNVRVGYIALPPDVRQVPWLSLHVKNGDPINSFSQAIARADNEEAMQNLPEKIPLPYGSYMRPEAFTVVSASEVLSRAPKVFEKLAHKVVILGGSWHFQGYNRGPQIDVYDTPTGSIPGVYIHANYVEALLDSRIYRPWSGWILILIEVIQSLLIAIPFALKMPLLFKILAVVIICLALFVFSLLSLMVLGLFFDFFIPVILVLSHGIIEQIRE